MAKFPTLNISMREKTGSNSCRTIRQDTNYKMVPGIIYGKGLESVAIQVEERDLRQAITQGAHLVMVDAGRGMRPAQFKEIQYDTFGDRILHFDLLRVLETDRVHVTVPLAFRHEEDAPGLLEGGVIERLTASVRLDCPATEIPEAIPVELNTLTLGQHLTYGDLVLPDNVKLHASSDKSTNIVVCHLPKVAPAATETPAAGGAPPTPGKG